MTSEFPGNSTIAQALPVFYKKYALSKDGGLSNSTIRIVLYKNICFYLPNIKARKAIVLKHDIHHIVTGYKSDFKGETEIGAWEIASGCTQYWVAVSLNLPSMMLGFLFNLPGVFQAFVRGKRSLNLYDGGIADSEAVNMTVDELRRKLALDIELRDKATIKEILGFLGWSLVGGIYTLLSIVFLLPVIVYSVLVAFNKK